VRGFLFRRLATSLLAVAGVVVLVFLLVHLIPGDPVDNMLGESADPRDKAALRACLDLDQPLLTHSPVSSPASPTARSAGPATTPCTRAR
jgi:ABC-type dipeptide/oligopeptide/nickel transport system permease component